MDKRLADVLATAGFLPMGESSLHPWTSQDELEDVWCERYWDTGKTRYRYRYVDTEGYTRIRSAVRVETVIRWILARPA